MAIERFERVIGEGRSLYEPAPPVSIPDSEIFALLQTLTIEAECADKLVSELTSRLSPVLRPEPPTAPANEVRAPSAATPLGLALLGVFHDQSSLSRRLRALLDRLGV